MSIHVTNRQPASNTATVKILILFFNIPYSFYATSRRRQIYFGRETNMFSKMFNFDGVESAGYAWFGFESKFLNLDMNFSPDSHRIRTQFS